MQLEACCRGRDQAPLTVYLRRRRNPWATPPLAHASTLRVEEPEALLHLVFLHHAGNGQDVLAVRVRQTVERDVTVGAVSFYGNKRELRAGRAEGGG